MRTIRDEPLFETESLVWYLAEILLAEPLQPDCSDFQCESCDVVFQAASAAEAYRKAVAWGQAYAAEPPEGRQLLGISQLTTIGEELRDGTEICGRFFQAPMVWGRAGEFVPPPDQLKAIQWEQDGDVPIGELLKPKQIALLKRRWQQGS